MKPSLPKLILGAAILLSIIMHLKSFTLPIQGKDTWRQTKTAWNIRYFVREDPNILNPRRAFLNGENNIERYEFPVMQWPLAMIERVVGEHILIERLFVFCISLLTLLAVYRIGHLLTNDPVIAALVTFSFTFLPTFFYNSTSIMPDLTGLCFSMYYIYFFFRHLKNNTTKDLLLSALFISLAGLAKLPFILLGIFSLIRAFQIIRPGKIDNTIHPLRYILIYAAALIPVITWYAIAIPTWEDNNIQSGIASKFVGWPLFLEFLENQAFTIFPTEILSFPAMVMLLMGVVVFTLTKKFFFIHRIYFFLPWALLTLYFLYILNVIREGHDYYHMPFYPVFLLGMIAGMHAMWQAPPLFRRLAIALVMLMPVFCWLRVHPYWNIKYAFLNNSIFECRDQFKTIGTNTERAIVINDISLSVFPYVIDKQSYIFWNDHLPIGWMKDLIKNQRAMYLYSDSRAVETQEGFQDVVDQLLLECGSIKVWKLKPADQIVL